MFPLRGILIAWVLECLLLIVALVLPDRFRSLEIPLPPNHPQWDVIYYSGDELPQTQDRGGAQAGKSGRGGGQQARHRTQTIHVARGDRPSERVVDAPKVNLPHSEPRTAARRGPAFRQRRADAAGDERGRTLARIEFNPKPRRAHASGRRH
jgi:hypothetical protein